jgi:hypothetical protein
MRHPPQLLAHLEALNTLITRLHELCCCEVAVIQ